MKVLSGRTSFDINERNCVKITKNFINPGPGNATRFILSKNSVLKTQQLTVNGAFTTVVTSPIESLIGDFLIIELPGYCPLEEQLSFISVGRPGNLSYIDGCSNSNLLQPPRNGDPCVNYLYIPPYTKQQMHIHPTIRVGLVLDGYGFCHTNAQVSSMNINDGFLLNRHEVHGFQTDDSHMCVAVFHPDSDDGPRDECNPMKSRTYLR